jgi:hypothetical protein
MLPPHQYTQVCYDTHGCRRSTPELRRGLHTHRSPYPSLPRRSAASVHALSRPPGWRVVAGGRAAWPSSVAACFRLSLSVGLHSRAPPSPSRVGVGAKTRACRPRSGSLSRSNGHPYLGFKI